MACQDEVFVNNPLDVKENDEHALDFAFRLSHLFSVSASLDFSIGRIVALCWIHCDIASRLQMKGSKKISTSIQLHEILCSNSQDILVV
jgi:hypothetical protein